MVTIHISDALAERLEAQGITDFEAFIERMIDKMGEAEVTDLTNPPPGSLIGKEDTATRIRELQRGFADMRAGMSAEALSELVTVINNEYIEPDLQEDDR